MFREYQAVTVLGWSHQEYLDTPTEVTDWLLHIHAEVRAVERDRQEAVDREARGGR